MDKQKSSRGGSSGGSSMADIEWVINHCPIIDNHAHPLLKRQALGQHPLESIVTEAGGDALKDVVTTLPFARAVGILADTLGCEAEWPSIVAAIGRKRTTDESYAAWVRRCLSGIQTILVDDGLDDEADDAFDYQWHDTYTRSPCKRIVRIEAVAARLINHQCNATRTAIATTGKPADAPAQMLDNVLGEFDREIREAIADPAVVGFKSVVCYRTGLDVAVEPDRELAAKSVYDIAVSHAASGQRFRRVDHAGLSDLLVHQTMALLRDSAYPPPPKDKKEDKTAEHQQAQEEETEKTKGEPTPAKTPPQLLHIKPIQFHTGLGDNDITLTKASPAHLQPLIRAFPTVPIVLLHSGYPFVRDTSYLATVYANVYADIGEVFPCLSRRGQTAVLAEMFELCPWSKVMWSTDGHWFPETYLLAIEQGRDTLRSFLVDFVAAREISGKNAVQLAIALLFGNANKLYNLGLEFDYLPDEQDSVRTAADRQQTEAAPTALKTWREKVMDKQEERKLVFVRIAWLDYTSMLRMRMIPLKHFDALVRQGKPVDIGITKACLGLLQNDMPVPGCRPVGEYRLHPDWSSLRHGPLPHDVTFFGDFREADGSPADLCPRSQLAKAVAKAAAFPSPAGDDDGGITFLIGFELEFTLVQFVGSNNDQVRALQVPGHAWSSARIYTDTGIPTLLHELLDSLARAGIEVEQIHCESATGQYEIVLPPLPPVAAVDSLLLAREIVMATAMRTTGCKATLHPKLAGNEAGTGAHVHLSLGRTGGTNNVDRETYEHFYAGILEHLPSLVAFTYSHLVSYVRVRDSSWAGGTWVAWGTQNRETPLRKIDGSHWEMKCMDGLANPYLALAAVLTAGLDGLAKKTPLAMQECTADPALISAQERLELGVTQAIPRSLGEALEHLHNNTVLKELLGDELVAWYVNVKETEMAAAERMEEDVLKKWIVDRY